MEIIFALVKCNWVLRTSERIKVKFWIETLRSISSSMTFALIAILTPQRSQICVKNVFRFWEKRQWTNGAKSRKFVISTFTPLSSKGEICCQVCLKSVLINYLRQLCNSIRTTTESWTWRRKRPKMINMDSRRKAVVSQVVKTHSPSLSSQWEKKGFQINC